MRVQTLHAHRIIADGELVLNSFPVSVDDPQDGDTLVYDADSEAFVNVQPTGGVATVAARTATAAPGGTTGVIADGTDFVTVTSDDANKVITLPTPTPGTVVVLSNGATGYELRSSNPATVAINAGVGANAESAIPANTLTVCACPTETSWLCTDQATDGSVVTTEVAAP